MLVRRTEFLDASQDARNERISFPKLEGAEVCRVLQLQVQRKLVKYSRIV